MTSAPGSPPDAGHVALLDALRSDLAPCTVTAVEEALGPVASAALHREQAVPALLATVGPADAREPAAVLVRLFVLGAAVTRAAVDAALPTVGCAGAERLGLVAASGAAHDDVVRARVDLRPYSAQDAGGTVDWWIASDLGELATGRPLRPDHVLGVGGASTTLAGLTVRDRRERTLDLGTGCGIQALHAARHSGTVVATDVSARALGFARLNAALAGVTLDLRQGSLLDPVREDPRFDLVVSNPPFVITPRGADLPVYEYRDAGAAGDDLVRDLLRGVGEVLAPGGVAQLLGNWEHRRGEDWRERVGRWLDDAGLDAWVVQREVQDPAQYAETWLRDGGSTPDRDPAGWARAYGAWLDDLASRDVEAVGFGVLTLRRPVDGPPTLRRLEEHPGPVHGPLGQHVAATLAAHDLLRRTGDDALLDLHLCVAGDVTEERHLVPGAADPSVVLLRQGGGWGRVVRAGTLLAGLVGACDGELTVGQVTAGLAVLLDVPVADVRAELLPAVRDLVLDGFLVTGGPGAIT